MNNIIRVEKTSNFVVMDKTALNDVELSWKAKGIMAFMLSKPDDWTFYLDELMKHATDGKSSFRSGFKELQDRGYIKRIRTRNEEGTFDWETVVYEQPHTDFPRVDKPQVEKPRVDNRTLLNNNLTKNDLTKNDLIIPYVEIIDYLNEKIGAKYKPSTQKTRTCIQARWNEGFKLDDFKKVIDNKVSEWGADPNMSKYLRPETLFGNKFEGYLNQQVISKKNVFSLKNFRKKPEPVRAVSGGQSISDEELAEIMAEARRVRE